jgi:hypothetical protein
MASVPSRLSLSLRNTPDILSQAKEWAK